MGRLSDFKGGWQHGGFISKHKAWRPDALKRYIGEVRAGTADAALHGMAARKVAPYVAGAAGVGLGVAGGVVAAKKLRKKKEKEKEKAAGRIPLSTSMGRGAQWGAMAGVPIGAVVGAVRAEKGERGKGALIGAGKGGAIGALAGAGGSAGWRAGNAVGMKTTETLEGLQKLRAVGDVVGTVGGAALGAKLVAGRKGPEKTAMIVSLFAELERIRCSPSS